MSAEHHRLRLFDVAESATSAIPPHQGAPAPDGALPSTLARALSPKPQRLKSVKPVQACRALRERRRGPGWRETAFRFGRGIVVRSMPDDNEGRTPDNSQGG